MKAKQFLKQFNSYIELTVQENMKPIWQGQVKDLKDEVILNKTAGVLTNWNNKLTLNVYESGRGAK